MSIIGIFVWFVLSVIVVGAFIWTTRILFQQKKAWAAYAKKYKLTYDKGTFLGAPAMLGRINSYRVVLYSEQKPTTDSYGQRSVTVVEVQLNDGLVDGGVAGTPGMIEFMRTMNLLHRYKPGYKDWNRDNHMYVRDDAVMDAFWSDKKLEALHKLLSMKNADVLFLFDDKEALIRVETTDPLHDPAKIERVVDRLFRCADIILEEEKKPEGQSEAKPKPKEGSEKAPSEDKEA